jgi:4-hydroxy-2-oxoheptanedioate aldolase
MMDQKRPRSLVRAWANGEITIGAACKIASSLAAEAVASVGFDYVYIDQQHGVLDNTAILSMFQAIAAAGAAPVTRVPSNQIHSINWALDYGAMGVIVPSIESAADAAYAAAACRYPPRGVRSYGLLRPPFAQSSSDPDNLDRAACIILVETEDGLSHLDEIAATPGIDAIMVGPQDLGLALGIKLEGDWLSSPKLHDGIEKIRAACERHGKVPGIGMQSGAMAGYWGGRGFRILNVGNDLGNMKASLVTQLAAARAAAGR